MSIFILFLISTPDKIFLCFDTVVQVVCLLRTLKILCFLLQVSVKNQGTKWLDLIVSYNFTPSVLYNKRLSAGYTDRVVEF